MRPKYLQAADGEMEVHLREAGPDDADVLSALARETYAQAFGHSMTEADLAAHLRNHLSPQQVGQMLGADTFLLASVAGGIRGFVQFGEASIEPEHLLRTAPFAVEPGDKEIRRLYVAATYQNRGVGSQLMDAALAHPRLAASTGLFLDVWQENERAQRFHERYGFEKVAEKRFEVEFGAATGVDFVMIRRSPEPQGKTR